VKIWDNDPARAMGARYAFPPIVRGSVEWWVNSETYSRLVALLESTGPDGTKNVEWIGLLANGKIEYYDGNARLNTVETYEPGKWYRFRVEFDATTHRKSIYVFDGGNLLL